MALSRSNLDRLAVDIEKQIARNRSVMDEIQSDSVKREARKSYMVANGKPPDRD